MSDKREEILEQLLVILESIPPLLGYDEHSVFRNRGEIKEDKRPCIIILDGVENANTSNERKGRVFMSTNIITLLPQIFVLLKTRMTPTNDGVGEELSTFRAAIIKSLADDKTLADLCGPNGMISFRRCETDMQTGSTLQGQMRLDFAINYVLDPTTLPLEPAGT
jgi:hypothetical protein